MATTTYRQTQQPLQNQHSNSGSGSGKQQADSQAQCAQAQSTQTQSGQTNHGPIESFRLNNVSISIFENESERDGNKNRYHRAKIDKRYHDQKSGEWKSTTSFSLDELLRLRYLIDSAVEFMAQKPADQNND